MLVRLSLSVTLVLAAAVPSAAIPITWQLTGHVTGVTGGSADELSGILVPGIASVEFLLTFDEDYDWRFVPTLGIDLQNEQEHFDYTATLAGLPFSWNGSASSYGQWNPTTRDLFVDGSIGSGGVDGTIVGSQHLWEVFAIDWGATLRDGGAGGFTMYASPLPKDSGPPANVVGTFTNVKQVPEPSTLLFLSLGALLLSRKRSA